jgi:hypothetical protein
MGKRVARGDIANFNFAKEYLDLKILRKDVEHLELSSRSHSSKADLVDRDAPNEDHCRRNSSQL